MKPTAAAWANVELETDKKSVSFRQGRILD